MANFGLSCPWVAKLDTSTGKYKNGFRCGKAVNTAVTPNFNEASMFADNQETEKVKEFKNATVTLGTDRLPIEASKVMFGHEVKENGEEINNVKDSSNYVGYGFITAERMDGKTKYRACILLKVLFTESEESYETKGDSLVFKNPTLSGNAMAMEDGEWRRKSPYFDTEQDTNLWIQKQLNVVESCAVPTASVEGGNYAVAQNVILSTVTPGAKIKYTTDGTTPSESNGKEYSNPVNIADNTGLRAYAYKEGMEPSEMMVAEYFIAAQEP